MSVANPPDAIVSFSGSATTKIIDAPTTQFQRIRIHSVCLVGAGNIQFSADISTPLTGSMNLSVAGGLVLPFNPDGWFTLPERTAFYIQSDAALGGAINFSILG